MALIIKIDEEAEKARLEAKRKLFEKRKKKKQLQEKGKNFVEGEVGSVKGHKGKFSSVEEAQEVLSVCVGINGFYGENLPRDMHGRLHIQEPNPPHYLNRMTPMQKRKLMLPKLREAAKILNIEMSDYGLSMLVMHKAEALLRKAEKLKMETEIL